MATDMRRCIEECQTCHAVCTQMIAHCLGKGGRHADADHIRLMLDCAQICATSADFMLRGSPRHHLTCGACAELCEACADDCERIADDEPMRRCVQACRSCAESCREMAAAGAH